MSSSAIPNDNTLVSFFSSGLTKSINVPGDKSITHRAIMFSSIAEGLSEIKTEVIGRDNFSTIRIFQQLGVDIKLKLTPRMIEIARSERIENIEKTEEKFCSVYVLGKGFSKLSKPLDNLDCGNSGTTARLLCGLFSSLPFSVTLVGDESLSSRPFARVVKPLTQMGASFKSLNNSNGGEVRLPLEIQGSSLKGISYDSPKSSAQVKSALILAGLYAQGTTVVTEPYLSRNHTEIMLKAMGANVESSFDSEAKKIVTKVNTLSGNLKPINVTIPGDISAAMFFIVAGLINPYGQDSVLIRNVGVNVSRSGCFSILKKMGAKFELINQHEHCGELVSDICVYRSKLIGVDIDKQDVAFSVDEIPIISVAASFAEGRTNISGAQELRVKESDRLKMTALLLKSYGVSVREKEDGLIIQGGGHKNNLTGVNTDWKSCGDHRISMCGAIMEYLLGMEIKVYDMKSIETSFPSFLDSFLQ